MNIRSGRAGYNSVSFTGDRYEAIAKAQRDEIIAITHVRNENMGVITDLISNVPLLRSFTIIVETVISHWKLFLFMMIASIIVNSIFSEKPDVNSLNALSNNSLILLIVILIISTLFIKLTPVSRYHAAEHMCANAYDKGLPITLDHVSTQSRVHKDCGTHLIISFIITYILLFVVFGGAPWVFLLSWAIGYEIWRSEPIILWQFILSLGKVAQYLLFTSVPQDKHLLVAISALKALEHKER